MVLLDRGATSSFHVNPRSIDNMHSLRSKIDDRRMLGTHKNRIVCTTHTNRQVTQKNAYMSA